MRSGRSRMFHWGVVGSVRFCRAVLDGRFGRRLGGRLLHIVPCWCSLGSFVRMGFRNSLPGGGRFTLRFHRSLDRRVCGRFRVGLLCPVLISALFFVFMLPGGGLLVRGRGGWGFPPPRTLCALPGALRRRLFLFVAFPVQIFLFGFLFPVFPFAFFLRVRFQIHLGQIHPSQADLVLIPAH